MGRYPRQNVSRCAQDFGKRVGKYWYHMFSVVERTSAGRHSVVFPESLESVYIMADEKQDALNTLGSI